ncbi:MAG: HlyD family efflux transporter periplasmic adaptor subunit [Bacteroidota bacterium]
MEEKEIELKTEEVNELLTAIPSWMVRWGITAIFFIMVLALSLSFFIRYPDILSATTTITTINPPVTLIAKTYGKITEIKVSNNQSVKQGEVLLVIESNANYKTILKIDTVVNFLQAHSSKDTSLSLSFIGNEWGEAGEITPAFISFLKSYNDYKLQLEINPQQKEIYIIDKQFSEYQILQSKYQNQETTYKEELSLIEKDFNRSNTLFQNDAISAKEFEDKKREYLSAKRNYESMKITNINNTLIISNLEKNRLQLQMQAYQERTKYEQALNQSMQALKSQIETWKQMYLLSSPIDGKVSLFNYWAKNQNLKQGDEVMSIVPLEKQEMIAKLFLPVRNSGKLKTGQTVNIKLNNYLFQEYGMLKGAVKNISVMPKNESYAIEVSLPNQLITTYNKNLEYKQEMQGAADIITEELSVFDRVFYQFRKLMR